MMRAGATLDAMAVAARRFGTQWCADAAAIVDREINRQLKVDTGGDGKLSGAPRMKAASTRVKKLTNAAYVKNSGSKVVWAWLEDGTNAHVVRPKAARRKRGRAAVTTPYGPLASVNVRGTKAKHTFTKGAERGIDDASRAAVNDFGRMF